jgi:anaerobic ribonucleoside-triphosphate reductase
MNSELDDLIGVDYGEEYYPKRQMTVIKKDGTADPFNVQKVLNAVSKSAFRASVTFTEGERRKICENIISRVDALPGTEISIAMMHNIVEQTLDIINPAVAKSYRDYRNYKQDFVKMLDEVYKKSQSIMYIGDKENSNTDSALVSTKRSLVFNQLNKELYKKFFLTTEELQACNDGYIYIHDMSARRDTMNCCLFDVGNVLKGGFEMGNVWYNEPKTLDTAFDVIGDIVLSGASQQYGGFTVPEVDKILAPYAEKSYTKYYNEYLAILQENGITENVKAGADAYAIKKVKRDFMQGVQGWEYKFNTVSSSRGDYPFITMTFGIGTSRFEKMASIAMLDVRREGQGKKDRKKPVLFPKLVFLYDENLHGPGKPLEDVFEAGIKCSAKTMYPDWLSLTGNGYVPSMYKQYGRVVSPMGCRAFLSPWYERGGTHPADKDDKPIFVGRFNIGVVSLHLPMILAKARQESKDFYDVLDYYLELIRKLHIRTYAYLGEMRASTNPLAYCEGGFLGGHLKPSDKIKPLLKPMTASFGITALNELQELYNGKSLVEDGTFAVEVMEYINAKINQFKEEDDILYALYGTPAENLCLSGDTEVNTPFGMKRIKDIVAGDIVYSYNENTKKVEEKQVLTSQKTQDHAVVVKITLTENKSVICTPNHPIAIAKEPSMDPFHWDNRFEYIEAKDLKKDQKLIICGDVPYAGTSDLYKVVSVEYLQDLIPVYNIEVADNHNYFVGGNEGILVHNCGLQIKQFREKYGVIPNVSDRPYVSNSFHCHVTEDITPIEKQDLEHRFWNTMNGGKIQYVKYPVNYNIEAIKTLVRRAMQMGYYEGVNLSLAYCDDCGHQELEMDVCPVCGSRNLTKIERMNGYLSYSRVHGDTRLNDAKMAEIADRKSM